MIYIDQNTNLRPIIRQLLITQRNELLRLREIGLHHPRLALKLCRISNKIKNLN